MLLSLPFTLYGISCISYSVYWYSAHSNSEETGREKKTDKNLVLISDFVLFSYFKVVAAVVLTVFSPTVLCAQANVIIL